MKKMMILMVSIVSLLLLSSQNVSAEISDETHFPDDYEAAELEIRSWRQEDRAPAGVTSSKAMTVSQASQSTPFTPSSSGNTQTTSGTEGTPRKATLNFEDELVEGGTQKPELFYLFQKKNFNYKRLIKLRENFIPEMRKTAEDVQRVRGPN